MVEVSRNVVAILLVLVVVVSGFGTYSLVMRDRVDATRAITQDTSGATVSLQIGEKPKTDAGVTLIVAGGQHG